MSNTSTRNGVEFTVWLTAELDARHWQQADLARAAHIDTGLLSRIMQGKQRPSPALCTAVAQALECPPESVFRAVGYLPPVPPLSGALETLNALYTQLAPPDQRLLLEFARLLRARAT